MCSSTSSPVSAALVKLGAPASSPGDGAASGRAFPSRRSTAPSRSTPSSRWSLRSPTRPSLNLLDISVDNPYLPPGVGPEDGTSLLRAAGRLAPKNLTVKFYGYVTPRGDDAIVLPCYDRTVSLTLYLPGTLHFAPPPAGEGEFTSLKELDLTSWEIEPGALLPMCPSLRSLWFRAIDEITFIDVTVHSPSLEKLLVDLEVESSYNSNYISHIDIVAPQLKKEWISIPREPETHFSASFYGPLDESMHADRSFAPEIAQLPFSQFSVLDLVIAVELHAFGPLMLQLLQIQPVKTLPGDRAVASSCGIGSLPGGGQWQLPASRRTGCSSLERRKIASAAPRMCSSTSSPVSAALVKLGAPASSPGDGAASGRAFPSRRSTAPSRSTPSSRWSLRSPTRPSLNLLDISVDNPYLPPGVGPEDGTSLLRAAGRLAPKNLTVKFYGYVTPRGDDAIVLPCYDRTVSLTLYLPGTLHFAPPPAGEGEFTSLKELDLTSWEIEPGALLPMCPSLRSLWFRAIDEITFIDVTVHSPSLEKLLVDLEVESSYNSNYISHIDIVAPQLKKEWISIPREPETHFSASFYGQLDESMHADRSFAQEIAQLPFSQFSVLDLVIAVELHAFGPLMLQLLQIQPVKTLYVLLVRFGTIVSCPMDCPCERHTNWRDANISLTELEVITLHGFTGEDDEVDFLKALFRSATALKSMTVNVHRAGLEILGAQDET
ncbi:hypothetical protein EJB05_35125, partial [Eragrostis curvula]